MQRPREDSTSKELKHREVSELPQATRAHSSRVSIDFGHPHPPVFTLHHCRRYTPFSRSS